MKQTELRICLIAREYPPATGWGGIGTYTRNLAHGLSQLGHEVEVVSLASGKPSCDSENNVIVHRVLPILEDGELELLGLVMPSSNYALRTSAALWHKFIELHQRKPFGIVDTPELLADGLFPATTKVAPHVVRLYTAHSKFIAEGFHNIKSSFDYELVALLERIAILNAEVITSPSLDLANFVAQNLKKSVELIKIVHNPINIEEFQPEGPASLTNSLQRKVLFVGRLEERKGVEYLIRALPSVAAQIPNAHFYIMGADTNTAPGGKSVKDGLCQIVEADKTGGNITFLPRVPLTELPGYYRSADVCVVPSLYDNSPYTCLEAMSCGAAVIGTLAGGTPEYIQDGESGLLVPPRDSVALSEAIIRLLNDEGERRRIGINARARVVNCFSSEKIAVQTVALYELARERFSSSGQSVYESDLTLISASLERLLKLYESSLNDMLYVKSLDYRIKRWLRIGKESPKVLLTKMLRRFG